MFHPRRFRTLLVISACATLALLLLSGPHAKSSRVTAQSAQSVPVAAGSAYTQTNLMSDVPGLAQFLDPLVVNTWGISRSENTIIPMLVHTGTSTATVYGIETSSRTTPTLALSIPGTPPVAVAVNPIFTDHTFIISDGVGTGPASFVFASPAGEITAWGPAFSSKTAKLIVSAPGHVYTGATIANDSANATAPGRYLYVADFANGKIDVYNNSFVLQTSGFAFTDPTVPPDYHPYNVQGIHDTLYVAYAKPGPDGRALKGPGLGYVRVFNADGVLMPGGLSNGELNAPWGVTIAPEDFGVAGGRLLAANTGDGRIICQGVGPLRDASGGPVVIEGLHGLAIHEPGCCFTPSTTLLFSAGPGDESHGLFGKIRSNAATLTSFIQFSAADYSASETAGHVDVTATRTGDNSGTATVNYNTFDAPGAGRAAQKSDYEISLGTLTFAPGETSKTFRVLLSDDNLVEGVEKLSLALSNVAGAGAGIGGADAATLTIIDDDSAPSSSNPVDDTAFFVRQHYLDFLNREPDAAGFNFWKNEIDSCGADARCREVRRINVSAAFFLSIEFRNTGLLAYLTNKAAVGPFSVSSPVFYGQFMHDVQQLQKGFVFGTPGAGTVLEANKQAYFAYTVARPEFVIYPTNLTPAQFVDTLFANAGVTPATAERDAAVNEFGGAPDTSDQAARARALRRVAENGAFASAEFRRAFVTMQYFGYLRRDADAAGFNFWLSKLNQFDGDFIRAEMVKAFITSDEYRRRFGAN